MTAAIETRATPATEQDLDQLAELFFDGFNDEYFAPIWPPTPTAKDYVRRAYAGFIAQSVQESRVFVVRDQAGKPLSSVVLWILRPGDAIKPWVERWGVPPSEGMDHKLLDDFFIGMETQHQGAMKDTPHVFVEVVVTWATERRKGYGSMMVQAGNELADEMDYICYLDAEKDARGLYEKCGYAVKTDVDQTSPLAAMVRPRKSQRS